MLLCQVNTLTNPNYYIDKQPLDRVAPVAGNADNVKNGIDGIVPRTSGEQVQGQKIGKDEFSIAYVNLDALVGNRDGEKVSASWSTNSDSSMVAQAKTLVGENIWQEAVEGILAKNTLNNYLTKEQAEIKLIGQLWDFSFRVNADRNDYVRYHNDDQRITGLADSKEQGTTGTVDRQWDLRTDGAIKPQFCVPLKNGRIEIPPDDQGIITPEDKNGRIKIPPDDPVITAPEGKSVPHVLPGQGYRYNTSVSGHNLRKNGDSVSFRLSKTGFPENPLIILTFSLDRSSDPPELTANIKIGSKSYDYRDEEDIESIIRKIGRPGAEPTTAYFASEMRRYDPEYNSYPPSNYNSNQIWPNGREKPGTSLRDKYGAEGVPIMKALLNFMRQQGIK
jgi:hypothetical protein